MGDVEDPELLLLRGNIQLLRDLIDTELAGSSDSVLVKAAGIVLEQKLQRVQELEQRHAFRVQTRYLSGPDGLPG